MICATLLVTQFLYRFRHLNLIVPKSQCSNDLFWVLETLKYVVDICPVSSKLRNNSVTNTLRVVESKFSLTNEETSNKRKVAAACGVLHEDYVDVMKKIIAII